MSRRMNSEEAECLKRHNDARARYGLKPLIWDSELARKATTWAQSNARDGAMIHSEVDGEGENLGWTTNFADGSYGVVQGWLDEEHQYKNEKLGEGDFHVWGHWTQCMWHDSEYVGVGKATSADGRLFVVARYVPQGNWTGERPYEIRRR